MKHILLLSTFFCVHLSVFGQNIQDTITFNQELDEVNVNALRAQEKTPITFTNIKKAELEKLNLGQDMPSILSFSPSVVATSDAGTGFGHTNLRIRGTDPSRINVTINGIPYNNPEYQDVYWVDLPDITSSASNIQIQRGVGSSSNGAASFGANINLKTGSFNHKPYITTSNSFGSFNSSKNNISLGTGKLKSNLSFDARISRITSDGYIDRSATKQHSVYFSGTYFADDYAIKGLIFGGYQKTHLAWDGIPKDSMEINSTYNSYTYNNSTDNYGNMNYQLHFTKQLNLNTSYNISTHYSQGGGYFELQQNELLPEDIIVDGDTVSSSLAINHYGMSPKFGGIVYSINHKKNNFEFTFGGASNTYKAIHKWETISQEYLGEINSSFYNDTSYKSDNNIYLKTNFSHNNTNIFLDIQGRSINYKFTNVSGGKDEVPNLFLNPKIGIHHSINNHHSAFLSFGKISKEPKRPDYLDSPIDEIPLHETLFDTELGYTFSTQKIIVSATLYNMSYKNQLINTGKINSLGYGIRENVNSSFRRGIELQGALLISNKLTWNANLTLSKNKISEYSEFVDNWDDGSLSEFNHKNKDISFSPNIIWSNQLNYKITNDLDIEFISKYVGEQYLDNTQDDTRKLDDYLVHKLLISYDWKSKLFKTAKINLLVNNLFNNNYASNAWVYRFISKDYNPTLDNPYTMTNNDKDGYNMTGYFPQAGRTYLLGLTLGF